MIDTREPSAPSLEIAHVLFMDIVAYSTLHTDQQHQVLHDLQEAVRSTPTFTRAQADDQLIRLPTGDGMALVFFRDPEAPVRCALELTKLLREHPDLQVRMGIHTGPVYRVTDINANRNVAGGGINVAQRVMDCGDAGHILVSGAEAEVLGQVSLWSSMLYDLGEVEVKHEVRIHLYNLYSDEAGNSVLPKKISEQRAMTKHKRLVPLLLLLLLPIVLGIAYGLHLLIQRKQEEANTSISKLIAKNVIKLPARPENNTEPKEAPPSRPSKTKSPSPSVSTPLLEQAKSVQSEVCSYYRAWDAEFNSKQQKSFERTKRFQSQDTTAPDPDQEKEKLLKRRRDDEIQKQVHDGFLAEKRWLDDDHHKYYMEHLALKVNQTREQLMAQVPGVSSVGMGYEPRNDLELSAICSDFTELVEQYEAKLATGKYHARRLEN